MVHFSRGVPDDLENFKPSNYINRTQFDYYAEIFYYYFSTVKDTVGQLLNVYYKMEIDITKLYFKDILKKIKDKKVLAILNSFLSETSLASQYRNSFAHRTPINYPDSRSSIRLDDSKLTYGSANHHFVTSSTIKANLDHTILSMAKLLDALKPLLGAMNCSAKL